MASIIDSIVELKQQIAELTHIIQNEELNLKNATEIYNKAHKDNYTKNEFNRGINTLLNCNLNDLCSVSFDIEYWESIKDELVEFQKVINSNEISSVDYEIQLRDIQKNIKIDKMKLDKLNEIKSELMYELRQDIEKRRKQLELDEQILDEN